jgi:hypothetical protein
LVVLLAAYTILGNQRAAKFGETVVERRRIPISKLLANGHQRPWRLPNSMFQRLPSHFRSRMGVTFSAPRHSTVNVAVPLLNLIAEFRATAA